MERTPPAFSKYRRVREAAEGLIYAPEEFGIREDEIQWKYGPDFFTGQTGKHYFNIIYLPYVVWNVNKHMVISP